MNKDLKLKTQADAVIHYIQHLDIDMLDSLLDDSLKYQDMSKDRFINKLGHAFNELIWSGDTFLNKLEGCCDSVFCNYKCNGLSFVGNYSGKYIDLIIDIEDGSVVDMYECSDFKTVKKIVTKQKRIKIDKEF